MSHPVKPLTVLLKQPHSTDDSSGQVDHVSNADYGVRSVQEQGPRWVSEMYMHYISKTNQALRAQSFQLRYQPAFTPPTLLPDIETGLPSNLIQARQCCHCGSDPGP